MDIAQVHDLIRQQRWAEASAACEVLCREHPGAVANWRLCGAIHLQMGRPQPAVAALRQAIALTPNDGAARMDLAIAAFRSGDIAQAREQLEHILSLDPAHALAAFHLGYLDQGAGNIAEAQRLYRVALASQPDYVDALLNLGVLLRLEGRAREAMELLKRAQRAAARRTDIVLTLAWSCLDAGEYTQAVDAANALIELEPNSASGWLAMGSAWRYLKAFKSAQKALEQAAKLAPANADIARELAVTLLEKGDYDAALAYFGRARQLAPDNPEFRWRDLLATCSFPESAQQAEGACARFVDGVEQLIAELASPTTPMWQVALAGATNTMPFLLHYQAVETTAISLRFGDLVSRIVEHDCAPLCTPPPQRMRAPGDRHRVGFVCSVFRDHTVTRYFSAFLGLDRARFEIFAWNLSAQTDATTARIAASVDHFEAVDSIGVPSLAQQIRGHQLDALVYLDVGMDGRSQVLAAMRLAPVQCVAYGHPVTTGLRNVDYFLSGAAMEPADADHHYREKLILLPGIGAVPQRPPAPGDGSWLIPEQGRPLLLCTQNVIKLTPAFDDILVRIAKATDARIIFFENAGLLHDLLLRRLGRAFAASGLDLDRFVGVQRARSYEDYLAGVAKADLVLDSPHFSGGRSSLDALSVGTPIVTCEGRWMRGRQTAAMLRIIGAGELVVADLDAYVAAVVSLCNDPERRKRLRALILENVERLFAPKDVLPAFEELMLRICTASGA